MELKLAKLPDRTPVKVTFTASADLARRLRCYTEFYNTLHGGENTGETLSDLVPYMIESFLESDRGFAKALKDQKPG